MARRLVWLTALSFWAGALVVALTAYWPIPLPGLRPVPLWIAVAAGTLTGCGCLVSRLSRATPAALAGLGIAGYLLLVLAVWGSGGASHLLPLFVLVPALGAASSPRWAVGVAAFGVATVVALAAFAENAAMSRAAVVATAAIALVTALVGAMGTIVAARRRDHRHLRSLAQASRISSLLDLDQALEATAEGVQEALHADHCVLYLLDAETLRLQPRVVRLSPRAAEPGEEEAIRSHAPLVGSGLTGWVAEHGQALLSGDAKRDPRAHVVPGLPARDVSYVVVPLKVGHRVLGVLRASRLGLDQYSSDDVRIAAVFASQAAIAIENARLYESARRLTITDGLTGLYNARHLQERLEAEIGRARRYGHPLALALIDSDSLKAVNDRFGHLEGDRLLRELGRLMRAHLRATDLLFRYAGDEFIVLLPETAVLDAFAVVDRIREAAAAHLLRVGDEVVPVSISAGLAGYPEHASDGEALIRAADAAMYCAKGAGKNRVIVAQRRSNAALGGTS